MEQLALDKHVRYILTTYPVVIWALSGNFDKNYNEESPDQNGILIGMTLHSVDTVWALASGFKAALTRCLFPLSAVLLLCVACVIFVVRIGLVIWRHIKRPLYVDVYPESGAMEPEEISKWQKKFFR